MDVNGVSAYSSVYTSYSTTTKGTTASEDVAKTAETKSAEAQPAAVYEKSDEAKAPKSKTYTQNTDMVKQMQADLEARQKSFQDMINKMFNQQTKTFSLTDDLWRKLASGDFTVDAETKAQAQKDIGEDGYWGVKQTSDRILDFAKALTGGDPDKIDKMRDAFEKGYKQAEKTWGGKLPDISQQTYDAVLKGFDSWKAESAQTEQA